MEDIRHSCGDEARITWRGQRSVEHRTASSRCSRRDEGIVQKVVRLVPYTSPRTSR